MMYIIGVYSTRSHQSLLNYPSNKKDLVVSNPHINMVNEEESAMMTLEADVSLKTAYNRLKIVQRHIIRMDMMARSKSALIDENRMK